VSHLSYVCEAVAVMWTIWKKKTVAIERSCVRQTCHPMLLYNVCFLCW